MRDKDWPGPDVYSALEIKLREPERKKVQESVFLNGGLVSWLWEISCFSFWGASKKIT